MSSNEIEVEQSTTELKYLGILKKIVVRYVVLLSNVYDFAKENSGDFKPTIVSVEKKFAPTFGSLYKNIKDLTDQTLAFVDDTFDKYAPSFAKNIATEFNSLLYEAKPLAKKLVTTFQAIATPPITATIFFLQTTKYFIQSITPEKPPTTTQTPTQSTPPADTTKTPPANQNPILGGLMGNAGQSLTPNPADLANQIANTTNSLVNQNPLLGAVSSAAQNIAPKPGANATKALLQTAYKTLELAGIPVVAQVWYAVNKEHPTFAEFSEFILPVAEGLAKLYNKVIQFTDGKGYSLPGYLPLIPIDEMQAAYKLVSLSGDGLSAVGGVLGGGLSAAGGILGGGLSAVGGVLGGSLPSPGDVVGGGLSAAEGVLGGGLSAAGGVLGGGLSAATGGVLGGDSAGNVVGGGLSAAEGVLGGGLSAAEGVLGGGLSAAGSVLEGGLSDATGGVLGGGLSAASGVLGGGLSAATGGVLGGGDKGLPAVGDALGVDKGLSAIGGLFGGHKK